MIAVKIQNYGNIPDIIKAYHSQKKDHVVSRRDVLASGDTLEISVQAREMQELKAALRDMDGIREEKVESLKKEISAGTYKIDAGKIASAIIEERLLDKQA